MATEHNKSLIYAITSLYLCTSEPKDHLHTTPTKGRRINFVVIFFVFSPFRSPLVFCFSSRLELEFVYILKVRLVCCFQDGGLKVIIQTLEKPSILKRGRIRAFSLVKVFVNTGWDRTGTGDRVTVAIGNR